MRSVAAEQAHAERRLGILFRIRNKTVFFVPKGGRFLYSPRDQFFPRSTFHG